MIHTITAFVDIYIYLSNFKKYEKLKIDRAIPLKIKDIFMKTRISSGSTVSKILINKTYSIIAEKVRVLNDGVWKVIECSFLDNRSLKIKVKFLSGKKYIGDFIVTALSIFDRRKKSDNEILSVGFRLEGLTKLQEIVK